MFLCQAERKVPGLWTAKRYFGADALSAIYANDEEAADGAAMTDAYALQQAKDGLAMSAALLDMTLDLGVGFCALLTMCMLSAVCKISAHLWHCPACSLQGASLLIEPQLGLFAG